ncbi:MAG: hydroxyacylglutathione hydrolase [Planctomycetota bacterium]|jgi:hydroxyacylglutathione hydrolase
MVVHSFFLGCLAHASYLIVDERSKTAAVIDPQRDVDIYFDKAKELGVEIKHVFLTHFHADFVSGHLEVRERSGATIYLGTGAGAAEYEHTGVAEGDAIEFGDTRIVAMETPGHTPESICYVLHEATSAGKSSAGKSSGGSAPHAVFTGDTLFVGDVGRPDLMASVGVTADELATMLYHSLHDKLLKLPDDTIVYPAHGAGSLCGKSLGTERSTTIGKQKASNASVAPMPLADFIARVTADQPQTPKYFGYDAVLNRKERGILDVAVYNGTRPLTADQFLQRRKDGAQVIDTRESDDFAHGSVRDAIHVPLSGSFATWSGAMLDLGKPILVIADAGKQAEAAVRLGRIGLDAVVGYLEGGMAALQGAPDDLQSSGTINVDELQVMLDAGEPVCVLDVRSPTEFGDGHIEGAQHVSLMQLVERVAEVPKDRKVCVICRTGARSSTAISMLMRAGWRDLANVRGGMSGWTEHTSPQNS